MIVIVVIGLGFVKDFVAQLLEGLGESFVMLACWLKPRYQILPVDTSLRCGKRFNTSFGRVALFSYQLSKRF